jgi:hypothetical protein
MDDQWPYRTKTTVLADLGPLPEVVETNSETLWKMFVELDEEHTAGFLKTTPSSIAELGADGSQHADGLSVQAVMTEARRNNRVCPIESEWRRLHAFLTSVNADDAPPPLTGAEYRRSAPLVRRIRVRDQVEWAAQHGLLRDLLSFIESLPEDHWIHMGD